MEALLQDVTDLRVRARGFVIRLRHKRRAGQGGEIGFRRAQDQGAAVHFLFGSVAHMHVHTHGRTHTGTHTQTQPLGPEPIIHFIKDHTNTHKYAHTNMHQSTGESIKARGMFGPIRSKKQAKKATLEPFFMHDIIYVT